MKTIDHALVSVIAIDGDKYLLIQEQKPGQEGLYNIPGGHVEGDETLLEAAVREMKEESGFEVELTGIIGIYQTVFKRYNYSGPVFSARVISEAAEPLPGHGKPRWVTQEELYELAEANKLRSIYPPFAINHYLKRGVMPLDFIASYNANKEDKS